MPDYSKSNQFDFRDDKHRRSAELKYEADVFPLGDKQRDKDSEILAELIKTDLTIEQKIYVLITCREMYQNCTDDSEERTHSQIEWFYSPIVNTLTLQERADIRAMTEMTAVCTVLDDYPDYDSIKNKGSSYLDEMNEWNHMKQTPMKKLMGLFKKK